MPIADRWGGGYPIKKNLEGLASQRQRETFLYKALNLYKVQ